MICLRYNLCDCCYVNRCPIWWRTLLFFSCTNGIGCHHSETIRMATMIIQFHLVILMFFYWSHHLNTKCAIWYLVSDYFFFLFVSWDSVGTIVKTDLHSNSETLDHSTSQYTRTNLRMSMKVMPRINSITWWINHKRQVFGIYVNLSEILESTL